MVSELPRDPRSTQPWNPEPLSGNYNECAQLSAVIIKANTNADNATTRAVMFHLGKYIPQGVPDTFGFNGIDAPHTTGDTVALTYPSGIGLGTTSRCRPASTDLPRVLKARPNARSSGTGNRSRTSAAGFCGHGTAPALPLDRLRWALDSPAGRGAHRETVAAGSDADDRAVVQGAVIGEIGHTGRGST